MVFEKIVARFGGKIISRTIVLCTLMVEGYRAFDWLTVGPTHVSIVIHNDRDCLLTIKDLTGSDIRD